MRQWLAFARGFALLIVVGLAACIKLSAADETDTAAIFDQVHWSTDSGRDHGTTASHRFVGREMIAFAGAGTEPNVATGIDVSEGMLGWPSEMLGAGRQRHGG